MENLTLGNIQMQCTGQIPTEPLFKPGFPRLIISGDYNAFNEGWNGWGVYMVSGLYTSETFTFPVYIGSAWGKDGMEGRITNHIQSLIRGNHKHNLPLQRSWNKRGQDQFVWFCLEVCEPVREICLGKEQKFLNVYRPFVDEFGGFNINKTATSGGREKEYSFKNPNGEIVKIKGLTQFCLDNNLCQTSVYRLIKGEFSSLKGWTMPPECKSEYAPQQRSEEAIKKSKELGLRQRKKVLLKDKDDKIIEVNGVEQFCKENNLGLGGLGRLISGKIKSYKGLRLATSTEPLAEPHSFHRKKYLLVDPEGNIVEIFGLYKFCRENNLCATALGQVSKGKRNHHKGWTKPNL